VLRKILPPTEANKLKNYKLPNNSEEQKSFIRCQPRTEVKNVAENVELVLKIMAALEDDQLNLEVVDDGA